MRQLVFRIHASYLAPLIDKCTICELARRVGHRTTRTSNEQRIFAVAGFWFRGGVYDYGCRVVNMDLHPYDDQTRCFTDADPDPAIGRALVRRLLYLPEDTPLVSMRYNLSFYSGGMGIIDKLAMTLFADDALWAHVASALHAATPEDAVSDAVWAEDLVWLFDGEEKTGSLRELAAAFINRQRAMFQNECQTSGRIMIRRDSDVNGWLVLWGDAAILNYLSFT